MAKLMRISFPEEIKDPVTNILYYIYEPEPKTVPSVIAPPFKSQKENQDIRQNLAYSLFEQGKEINIPLIGTPGSGISSYLIAEALNRDEPVLLVSSNKNVYEIISKAVNKSNRKDPVNVVSILPAKKGCSKIQLDLEKYPKLYDIPIIPLPKIENGCKGCEFYESCKYTEILRVNPDSIDVIVISYEKLVALMLNPSPVSREIVKKITEVPNNVIFDECHTLELENIIRVTIAIQNQARSVFLEFNQFESLYERSQTIKDVITEFKNILSKDEVKTAISEILQQATDKKRWAEKHHRIVFHNNTIAPSTKQKLAMDMYKEMVDLVKKEHIKDNVTDIQILYDILSIIRSDQYSICASREKSYFSYLNVQITAVDTPRHEELKFFPRIVRAGKRVIFTSGTILDSTKYPQFFNTQVPVMWGAGGDPLDTNSKMLILPDIKKYDFIGKNSFCKNKNEIVENIEKIRAAHAEEEIGIVAMNRRLADELSDLFSPEDKTYIDYYNSKNHYIPSDCRILIAVGCADKPINTFDPATENEFESRRMYMESMHADTWKTWNMVKDSEGKEPCVVYSLGVTKKICKDIATWGKNRIVMVGKNGRGFTSDVVCRISRKDEIINKPKFGYELDKEFGGKCKNIDDIILSGKKWMSK
ncbi:ATP-dependent DNA helicase [Methanosarcina mazei]|uniref:Helicase ATP-binding domain-containing protein n=1 Tax=Methanosarcina mazei TaxID=2209 RepID=A0A0F8RUX8_METMZ|nr:hypothetical protein [Methanosarcina mazei]KKG07015.1 hypothetical protein DU47_04190 [Methanosarcina mazei]KKH91397.1 hypothetical protein DU80_11685 [Methanosarcina mazei]